MGELELKDRAKAVYKAMENFKTGIKIPDYTDEQRRGLRYRDLFYKRYYPGIEIPVMENDVNTWGHLYKMAKHPKELALKEIVEKEFGMESDRNYSFVAAWEDVDYMRILKEAPEGTPFVLVETQTRTRQAKDWYLFIHQDILSNEKVQGLIVGGRNCVSLIKTISPTWGHEDNDTVPVTYRFISGDGAIPGYIKQQVEAVKRALNPKDTKTKVSFL